MSLCKWCSEEAHQVVSCDRVMEESEAMEEPEDLLMVPLEVRLILEVQEITPLVMEVVQSYLQ